MNQTEILKKTIDRITPPSTVEKILQMAEEKKERIELSKEEMKDFKKAVNSLMYSKNFKLFWRMSKKLMKIDSVDQDFTPINMAVAKAYRNYYQMIMNLCDSDVRADVMRDG